MGTGTKLDFDRSSLTYPYYQLLKDAGFQDAEIDAGYQDLDYSRPTAKPPPRTGAGDHLLRKEEVYEFLGSTFDKFQTLTAAGQGPFGKFEKLKLLLQKRGELPPWILDDFDPNTEFDAEVRKKIQTAIKDIRKELIPLNLSRNDFNERTAVALYYLLGFPAGGNPPAQEMGRLRGLTAELRGLGLTGFETKLYERGGLGLWGMSARQDREPSALEGLADRRGWCTVKSKVLYAAFRMAGFEPAFVYANAEDVKPFIPSFLQISGDLSFSRHSYIGVNFGKKRRYFDLSLYNSNAAYPNAQTQNLRHFYASHESNRSAYLQRAGKIDEGMAAAKHAVEIDPKFADGYLNLATAFQDRARHQSDPALKKADYAEALNAAKLGVQFGRPNDVALLFNLGMLYKESGDSPSAADTLSALGREHPDFVPTWGPLGIALIYTQKLPEALAALKRATELNPSDGESWNNLAYVLLHLGREPEALEAHRRAQALGMKSAR